MYDLALDGRLFLYDEFDCAIQELDLLFNTNNTELIGEPGYGVEFERYLWILTPTTDALQTYLNEVINTHTTFIKKFSPQISCEYAQGSERSIYEVKINLKAPDNTIVTRNYRFQ